MSTDPLEIVPDDFPGIDNVRGQRSSTPPEKRKQCPKCQSTSIVYRKNGGLQDHASISDHRYRCDHCQHRFDHPVTPDPEQTDEEGDETDGTDTDADSSITHPRTCEECGRETFAFERCHRCGDVPWKDGDA